MDTILRAEEIYKVYQTLSGPVYALSGINLKIEKGLFYTIIGKSGSGKSTLIQHLNGLIKATSGALYYNGENIDKANEIVRLSTTEYENGEINYVEYVNALNEAIDMRMKQADVINEYNEAVLALMALNNSL